MIAFQVDSKALTSAIASFGSDLVTKVVKPSVEMRANEARREAVRTFVSRGIGKGIFGRNDSGAYRIIRLEKVTTTGGGVVAKLVLSGLARLQETGGRIKAHTIKPKNRKFLAFAVAGGFGFGGDMVFAKSVRHPGAPVTRYPAGEPAMQKAQTLLLQDIGSRLASLWGQGKAA